MSVRFRIYDYKNMRIATLKLSTILYYLVGAVKNVLNVYSTLKLFHLHSRLLIQQARNHYPMDKVNQLKEALRKYLENWVEYHPDEQTGIPLSIIESESDGHFFLLEFGNGAKGWVHTLFVHLQVTPDAKVILFKNNTEEEPFAELTEMGISPNDLLVGWVPPKNQTQLKKQAA